MSIFDSDELPEKTGSTQSGSIISIVPPPDSTEDNNTVVDPVTGTNEAFILGESKPESVAETVRQSGLAYSAGIAFFASVVFMLIIGWGADLLFGSSPWGIVVGIVIGSVIGFVQFFRITSQIFNPKKKKGSGRMLTSNDDEPK